MSRSFWRDRCCPPSSGSEGNELATERPWPVLRGGRARHSIRHRSRNRTRPKSHYAEAHANRHRVIERDQGGLALLLIAKGVFTAEEYAEAMRLAANTELAMREAEHPGITFR